MKNVLSDKYYCMLCSFNEDCSFWCFPPLPCSQVSVSELVTHRKFFVLLPKSLQLLLLKLFADVIFQGSKVKYCCAQFISFFPKQFVLPEHFFNTEF